MKKLHTILAVILITATTFAQAPEKMSYQAVVRDSGDALVTNQAVGMQISILQTTATGIAVYVETQTPTTNANGLVSIEIGMGSVVSGDFSALDWSAGPYFIKTEIDATGGSGYTITGTSELLSVPYALHAKTAESVTSTCGLAIGDTHQGGIIFYLDASGCHGLISAPSDQSTAIQWSNGSSIKTNTFANGIGGGFGNTYGIIDVQGSCGGQPPNCYASGLCSELILGGRSDWYLPSIYELKLLYENIGQGNALGLGNIAGLADALYWSSTEKYDLFSHSLDVLNGGTILGRGKNFALYVRAIRAF